MRKSLKIGCGIGLSIIVLTVVAFIWLSMGPESGVKLGNEMDEYAIKHISDNKLLMPNEELIAYYDVTISMDGSESAIITNMRIIYFKNGKTTYFDLDNIRNIDHRYGNFTGDIIEVEDTVGRYMKIEIAPLNQGETFLKVLRNNWERTKTQ